MENPLVSIIVPVYNVEKYILPCIESIFRQGLDDNIFEVIIVNDGTEDKSMEVIADIISLHTNIIVINQENLSLSVARNNGIAKAKGEYIFMPDSDDLLIDNSLKYLLDKAIESKADLIVADFLIMNSFQISNLRDCYPLQKCGTVVEKSGQELFLQDLNPNQCYVWRTLYRRMFLLQNHLAFIPGVRCQDFPFTHECYIRAEKCLRVSWNLYIYRHPREFSLSYTHNKKKGIDFCVVIAKTWSLKKNEELSSCVLNKLNDDVYSLFTVLLSKTFKNLKDLSEWKSIIVRLKELVPDLYFANGVQQRIMSFIFWHTPNLLFPVFKFSKRLSRVKMRVVRRLTHPSIIINDARRVMGVIVSISIRNGKIEAK